VPKAQFYGVRYSSTVTFVFNPSVSESKSFSTINYEGSQNWALIGFETETDTAAPISEYYFPSTLAGLQNQLFENKFKKKENKYFANLLNISSIQSGDVLYVNPITNPNKGQIISGVKGFYAIATFSCANATVDPTINRRAELFAVSAEYVESSY
jgi:exosortase/archaeosortase